MSAVVGDEGHGFVLGGGEPWDHMGVERRTVAVGFGQEGGPVEVVGGFHIDGVALGGTGTISQLEVALEVLFGKVVLLIGVVYQSHIIMRHGVGIVGIELQYLGEIASDARDVEVALDGVEAEVEVEVGVFWVALGEGKERDGGGTVAVGVVVLHGSFQLRHVGLGHLVGEGALPPCGRGEAEEDEQEKGRRTHGGV